MKMRVRSEVCTKCGAVDNVKSRGAGSLILEVALWVGAVALVQSMHWPVAVVAALYAVWRYFAGPRLTVWEVVVWAALIGLAFWYQWSPVSVAMIYSLWRFFSGPVLSCGVCGSRDLVSKRIAEGGDQ